MGVGTKKGFSGDSKALHVNGMAHSIASAAVPNTKLLSSALKEEVVIGILKVGLDQIVVDILSGKLCLDLITSHRLELEHHHRARCILAKGLINPQLNLFPHLHLAINEVALNQLVRYALSCHIRAP